MSERDPLPSDPIPATPGPSSFLEDRNVHLASLTGLRAVAAFWVVLFHYWPTIEAWWPGGRFLSPITSSGYLGVDLFFALSGFVMCHRYLGQMGPRLDRHRVRDFLALRIARLYPVHLFMILVFGAYGFSIARTGDERGVGEGYGLGALVENIFMVHSWWNQPLSWNGVAWSVSLEWLAYLCFPFIALLVWRLKRTSAGAAVAGFVLVLVYIPLVLHGLGVISLPDFGEGPAGLNLVRIGAGFVGGCAMYLIANRIVRSEGIVQLLTSGGFRWAFGGVVLSAIWLAGRASAPTAEITVDVVKSAYGGVTWLVAPLLALSVGVLALASLPERGSRFFESRPMILGGLWSYSVYMTHTLVITLAGGVFGGGVSERLGIGAAGPVIQALWVVLVVVACGVAGFLVYSIVEEPARRALRRSILSPAQAMPVEERSKGERTLSTYMRKEV